MSRRLPRLRTADRIPPPYPLGQFPPGFGQAVGRQIIVGLATRPTPTIKGEDWERVFARAIGAEWAPSNVGLDDVVLGNCAWGAKTVLSNRPWESNTVRLISGRNSPVYSYGGDISTDSSPDEVGEQVLEIWNARVESVRAKHAHVRTVVLLKGPGLLELGIFEVETLRYDPEVYTWSWNQNGNLVGHRDDEHHFTWQPHGSQFTIIQRIPENRLKLRLRKPDRITEEDILAAVGYDDSWVEIVD